MVILRIISSEQYERKVWVTNNKLVKINTFEFEIFRTIIQLSTNKMVTKKTQLQFLLVIPTNTLLVVILTRTGFEELVIEHHPLVIIGARVVALEHGHPLVAALSQSVRYDRALPFEHALRLHVAPQIRVRVTDRRLLRHLVWNSQFAVVILFAVRLRSTRLCTYQVYPIWTSFTHFS